MTRTLELKKMDYHRNGVSGVGFHVALFVDLTSDNGKPKTMLGVLFDNAKDYDDTLRRVEEGAV